MRFKNIFCFGAMLLFMSAANAQTAKKFLVCGDTKVLLVDYNKSKDSIPEVIWTWDASQATDLSEDYRKKFRTMDDCKAINDGKQILVSSSSGAIAVVNLEDKKVMFVSSVPNSHSIALLPDNRIAAAASTNKAGNKIMLFDIAHPEKVLYTDSLYSAHGLVWDAKRKSLFALGYSVLREYKIVSKDALQLKNEWKIPGIGGHELQPSPDGGHLFVTEHNGTWVFNIKDQKFSKLKGLPDAENVKSLGQIKAGQYIYTIPEESWWTFHVKFSSPERVFAFPGLHVYKARWFTN
ncbi:DUF6528 family protein [Chitinophaga barathri]|nr:DUF6528 family protein [Chitinophaga barathri]